MMHNVNSFTEKFPESIQSSKIVSNRARMSGKFDSRKDSQSTKTFEQRSSIYVKLSFRELCDSKFSGLHPFHNMAIIHGVKK